MRTGLVASCALFLSLASTAHAADFSVTSPTVSPSWTGFYAGGFIGGRASNVEATSCGGGPIGQNCPTDFSLDGLIAGFTAGYDHQFSNGMVLGAFASIPVLRPTATTTTPLFVPFGLSWKVQPQYALYAGARLGYAVGDIMPYVIAGASLVQVEVTPQP
jgi:opacity protein-like surface antigen